jgi:hypothetical protein
MENAKRITHNWKLFGIITFALSILNLAFACIPYIGWWAIYSGILPVILSAVVLIRAIASKTSKRIAMISLFIALGSVGMGIWTLSQLKFDFKIQPGWDGLIIKH